MAELFISYRRGDQDITGRMYDRLAEQFGKERIFKDVDNIPVGVDFRKALAEAVQRCDVLLAIVGDNWVDLADGTGRKRLNDPNDFVRIEIESALQRDIPIIPVLVHGAEPPTAGELPDTIAEISYRQVARLRSDPDFAGDMDRLCAAIDAHVRGKQTSRAPSRPAATTRECPYRGLESFRVDDANLYFGREDLIELALGRIREFVEADDKLRFLAIIGASGSGKSSLAYAGVMAAIQRDEIEGSSNWLVAVCRPAHNPLEGLAMALAANPAIKPSAGDIAELIDRLKADQRRLHLTTRLALEGKPENQRVVVLVDQFEEIFRPGDEDLKEALIHNLLYAASVPDGRTIVLLTMRADFYAKASAYPHLAKALSTSQILVGPMSETQRRRAIEEPAKLVGASFEPGLVEMLIQDMKTEAGALPFLQDALTQLWDRQENGVLSVEDYKAIGRLEGAVEHRANVLFQSFSESEKEICRRLFLRLTQPGEGTEDTKRRVPRSELGDSEEINRMVQRLTAARLITTEGEPGHADQSEAGYVEVSHEALIRGWSQLRRWIDEDRDALRIQHQLTTDAAAWKSNPDDAFLYRGTRLGIAEEWVGTHLDVLTTAEREFLEACRSLRDQERYEKALAASRLRRRAWVAGIAAIVATVLAGVASLLAIGFDHARQNEQEQRKVADRQAQEALHQSRVAEAQRLATEAEELLQEDPFASIQRASQAVWTLFASEGIRPKDEDRRFPLKTLRTVTAELDRREKNLVLSDRPTLMAPLLSPKSRWLVSQTYDRTVNLWNLERDRAVPRQLNLRIALHVGPVQRLYDPITERENYLGAHVNRAARLEPKTPPGQVYASQAFAAIAAAECIEEFSCHYVRLMEWSKQYGSFPTYVVRRHVG